MQDHIVSFQHSPWLHAVRRMLSSQGYRYAADIDLQFSKRDCKFRLVKKERIGIDGPLTGRAFVVEILEGPPDWLEVNGTELCTPRVDSVIVNFLPQIEHIRHILRANREEVCSEEAAAQESQDERDDIARHLAKRDPDEARLFRALPFVGARESKHLGADHIGANL